MIVALQEGRFWSEGKFVSTMFRRDMKVLIYNGADKDYAELCVKDFNNMSPELTEHILRSAYSYCLECLNRWAEIDKRDEIESAMSVDVSPDMAPEKLLKCMTPLTLSVRESQDGQVGWQAEFDCQWEPEKGMEIVVLGGKLLYRGAFCDHSPWDSFPDDDSSNHAVRC